MAKFKVGDKVKYYGRRAVVTEVHHDGESDYLLDVEGAGSGWYADEDEVTAANAVCNAKDGLGAEIKVGDTAKFLTGTWRGLEGKVLKIDGSRATVRTKEQGDVVEDLKVIRVYNAAPVRSTNAVVRNALAAVCNGDPKAYDHSGHLVKVGDVLDTRKGLAKIVRIKSRQDKPGLASWVGVSYKPDGTSVDEWLMTGVHGTLGSGIEAANARTAQNATMGEIKAQLNPAKVKEAYQLLNKAAESLERCIPALKASNIAKAWPRTAEMYGEARSKLNNLMMQFEGELQDMIR